MLGAVFLGLAAFGTSGGACGHKSDTDGAAPVATYALVVDELQTQFDAQAPPGDEPSTVGVGSRDRLRLEQLAKMDAMEHDRLRSRIRELRTKGSRLVLLSNGRFKTRGLSIIDWKEEGQSEGSWRRKGADIEFHTINEADNPKDRWVVLTLVGDCLVGLGKWPTLSDQPWQVRFCKE